MEEARSEHCPTSLIGFLSVHHGVVGIKVAEHSNGEVHPAWHEPISDQTQSTLPYLKRPSECLQRHQLVAFETFFIDREQARMGLGFRKDEYAKGMVDPSHSPNLTSAFLEYGMTRMGTMLARRRSQGTDIVDAENAMVVIPAPSWIDKCCPKKSSGACPEAKDGNERNQCVPISGLAPRVFDPKVCVCGWKQRGEGDGWRSLADQFG
ncbi:hypothetical protein L1987_24096 [Smallanthus sonchifolius]|uniref:Uncharacterized protein n=1 Tax=Smallanthus sonchifolius TaxID=185202 RepID=A0ACB9IKZ2_9ASTR|nr:hypothetical protein L1987_24096 [Smallanthus sonchifolius]